MMERLYLRKTLTSIIREDLELWEKSNNQYFTHKIEELHRLKIFEIEDAISCAVKNKMLLIIDGVENEIRLCLKDKQISNREFYIQTIRINSDLKHHCLQYAASVFSKQIDSEPDERFKISG